MVTYKDYSDTAEKAVEALDARREEIGKGLQEAFRILRALKGKAVSFDEFMKFWKAHDKTQFEKLAIQTWLETNKPGVPLTPGREHLAVPLPEDARDLWEALEVVRYQTEDPGRYWNEESNRFFGLPVDQEEEEKIRARYVVHALSTDHAAMLRLLETMAGLINIANRRQGANITPAKLEESTPWLARLCQVKKIPHPRYSGHLYEFRPNMSLFCAEKEDYRAFDEVFGE